MQVGIRDIRDIFAVVEEIEIVRATLLRRVKREDDGILAPHGRHRNILLLFL